MALFFSTDWGVTVILDRSRGGMRCLPQALTLSFMPDPARHVDISLTHCLDSLFMFGYNCFLEACPFENCFMNNGIFVGIAGGRVNCSGSIQTFQ